MLGCQGCEIKNRRVPPSLRNRDATKVEHERLEHGLDVQYRKVECRHDRNVVSGPASHADAGALSEEPTLPKLGAPKHGAEYQDATGGGNSSTNAVTLTGVE